MPKTLDPNSQEYKDMFREVETSKEFKDMVASNITLGQATDNPNTTEKQQDAASEAQIKATDAYTDKATEVLEKNGYGIASIRKFIDALDKHGRAITDAVLEAGDMSKVGQQTGADGKAALCVKSAQNKGQCR